MFFQTYKIFVPKQTLTREKCRDETCNYFILLSQSEMQTVSSKCSKKRFGIFKNTPFDDEPLIKHIPLHFQFTNYQGFVLNHARKEFKSNKMKNKESNKLSEQSFRTFDHRNKIFDCSRCKGTGAIDSSYVQNRRTISTSKRDRKSVIFNYTRSNSVRNTIQPSEIEGFHQSANNNQQKLLKVKTDEIVISKPCQFLRQMEDRQQDVLHGRTIQINLINSESNVNNKIMDPSQFYELIKQVRSSKRVTRKGNPRVKENIYVQSKMIPYVQSTKQNLESILDRQKWIYKI